MNLQQNGSPNIIFILIDDMGWRDLSCYGSSFYETPNLDNLAARGMRFENAYASCPVCSPTRASVMTGKYPATVGITDWIDFRGRCHPCKGRLVDEPYLKHLPQGEYTLPQALRDGGYNTWHLGKWHLGDGESLPQNQGFNVNVGGCEVGSPAAGGYFSPWSIPALQDVDVPDRTYLTDYLTDHAIDLIHKNDAKPFFLNLWYYSVHTPIQAKQEYIDKYIDKAKRMGLDQQETFAEGEFFPTEHKRDLRVKRRLIQSDPVYAAMIEILDENIGRLFQAVKDVGQEDNTIIVFTSDNGGLATAEGSPTCNAPLAEGKGWMYEGGTREPLIAYWPGVTEPGSSCAVPVTTPDFYPTFLEMAGLLPRPDQHVDGVSLAGLLKGENQLSREAIYWHYPHYGNQGGTPGSSMRMGDYKLIEFFEDGRIELYNLAEDISEATNLADKLPELASQMKSKLTIWRESIEAKIPQLNLDWQESSVESGERKM